MGEAATEERRAEPRTQRISLVEKFADRFGIEPEKLLSTLKATAFKQGKDRNGNMLPEVTNEQMAALLIVADQYHLNPFTRELYAFQGKGGIGIVPIVSVDGWARIANEHPAFDGVEFIESEKRIDYAGKTVPIWIEAVIWRKDRSHATIIREYFDEVVRRTDPWDSHPTRMLRHKAFIQGVRMAFGFAGIYDADEGERIAEVGNGVELYAPEMPRAKSERRAEPAIDMPAPSQSSPAPAALTTDTRETLPPLSVPKDELAPAQSAAPKAAARGRGKAAPPPPADDGQLFDAVESQSEGKAPPASKAPAPEESDLMLATDGEKGWILGKLAALDMDPAEAISTTGLSVPADLTGLTADGFIALKEYVREIS